MPLTFSLIIGTVVFQSLTSKAVADKLGISNPVPNGVLFVGANEISLPLAKLLRDQSIMVLLSDTSWSSVRAARQSGFEAYHGNPTSGHASENLDLQGIGNLIAVSSNRDTNALTGMHFRRELGANSVFTLEGASDDEAYERFDTANRNRANPLFDRALSHSRLRKRIRNGEFITIEIPDSGKKTDDTKKPDAREPVPGPIPGQESEKSSSKNYAKYGVTETDLPLFAISDDRKLHIFGAGDAITLKAGWKLIVLRPVE